MAKLKVEEVYSPVVITLETEKELEAFTHLLEEVTKPKNAFEFSSSVIKLASELLQLARLEKAFERIL